MTSECQFKDQLLTSDTQFLNKEISSHEQRNARIRPTDMCNLSQKTQERVVKKF